MTRAGRTVAILSPDFSPSSLPSSIRARLFATHLPEFGWRPVVITTAPKFYTCPLDTDNNRLLPEDLEVIRTGALPARQMRRFGIGDVGMRSLWHHWTEIGRLCRARAIDVLLVTVPPSVPMILGRFAWERFGLPYVIDYQDPWITEVYWNKPRSERPPKWPLTYALSRLLEPPSIRRASYITGVSAGTVDGVLERYPQWQGLGSSAIPFGAEPADFNFLRQHPRRNPCFEKSDGFVHLVYAGVCIPGMYPALRCLFGGLRLLREKHPQLAARMRLHFVGTNYAASGGAKRAEPIAKEFGVADLMNETPGRVSYLDAMQLMLDATGLLIVGTDEPHYVASKVYPYALSGRPIFAIFHERSSAVEALSSIAPARIMTFGETRPAEQQTEAAATHLESLANSAGVPAYTANIPGHTARDMTGRLAHALDRVFASKVGRQE